MTAAAVVIPVMIAIIIACGLYKRVDVFSEFAAGARENLTTCAELLPTLIALITAVGMFRASGAEELLTGLLSGFFDNIGFPAECLPLALIRPVSGSGALAYMKRCLKSRVPTAFRDVWQALCWAPPRQLSTPLRCITVL